MSSTNNTSPSCDEGGGCLSVDDLGDLNAPPEPVEPESCIEADVQVERVIPTVMMVVDRSGSMYGDMDGITIPGGYESSRWNVLRHLLLDETTGVVKPLEDTVRFGLSLYTTGEFTCPRLSEVPPDLGQFDTMAATYRWDDASGGTPTPDAVEKVVGALDRSDLEGPKILILATDGTPGSCTYDDPDQKTIDFVQVAYGKEITTFVINVGDGIDDVEGSEFLANVAAVGQGHPVDYRPPMGDLYYGAADADELRGALEEIIFGSLSCEFELEGEVKAGLESTGTVELDDEVLAYNDEDRGWHMKDSSTLELLGTACDDFLRSEANLKVDFPCEAYPTVVK